MYAGSQSSINQYGARVSEEARAQAFANRKLARAGGDPLAEKVETARRVLQRVSAVLQWAVTMEVRSDNPRRDRVGATLGRQRNVRRHMPALPHRGRHGPEAADRCGRERCTFPVVARQQLLVLNQPQPYADLFIMNADGSDQRPLTDNQYEGTPAWLPAELLKQE